ncbi:DUF3085 domain-containing protein [Micromonospora sp. NPDC049275]|uniref:DUF3085 domain-containing protein n=1 Tax=Micromonospora sp. NPDC049275 TaxID=3364268 RepID=UPI0037223635
MALHLYFDLRDALLLAEHAVAAAERVPSFTEREAGTPCPGALEWVHDQGVYLISNGMPRLNDPDQPDANLTVYADGWNPDTDDHRYDPDLGGDDFVEHLHLTEAPAPLIETLREARAAGYEWLRLTVDADTYDVSVTRTRQHD